MSMESIQTATQFGNPNVSFTPQEEMRQEAEAIKNHTRMHMAIDKIDFPSLIEIMYVDSTTLCELINAVLHQAFVNYNGSKIDITPQRQILATIYFTDKNEQPVPGDPANGIAPKISGIESIINNKAKSTQSYIDQINSNIGGRKYYKLTKEARQYLVDLIPNSFINWNTGRVDWNKCTVEEAAPAGFAGQIERNLRVVIDINKFLKLIYGDKTSDGGVYNYLVNVVNPINPVMTPGGVTIINKWQILIYRLNNKDVADIAREYGYSFGGNSQGIITSF